MKISQRGGTGGESDSTTYMLKPLLNLVFPHGNGENTWLLVKVAQPSSLGSVRDGRNEAKKPLGTQDPSTVSMYEKNDNYLKYLSPKGGKRGTKGKAKSESIIAPSGGEPFEKKGREKEMGCTTQNRKEGKRRRKGKGGKQYH